MHKFKTLGVVVLLIVIVVFVYGPIQQSYAISSGSGTVLTKNWWESLNWIKNNTANCSVIATYWDPGHFITAIAQRAVVFDGASQGEQRTIEIDDDLSEDKIKEIAVLDNYLVDKSVGKTKIKTARIQDIATAFFTDNESIAAKLLEKYKNPGCDDVYFLASSDLIGKSVWWTYFSTWKPGELGKQYTYSLIQLSRTGETEDGGDVLVYQVNQQQAFIIYQNNDTIKALIQQGDSVANVESLAYFDNGGKANIITNNDAVFKGMLWLDPSNRIIVFIPPEIKNSLFTKMFFFNGVGLKNFEFVDGWGGEVKLFKLKTSTL